ncbi:MAG: AzlC family ABC transporter permease [Christensenellaceae bacterium]|nr:AzlC family ABC transporter permease [Christensenellaceae bacterium]
MEIVNKQTNKKAFKEGFRDGIPIGLGYFAVSFSLGIAARNAGLNALEGFIASALCNASAGQYAGFALIAANASYIEIALVTLIANARYLLMSAAMSQRISPKTGLLHRLIVGHYITDELFGIAIAKPGYLNPWYTYGAVAFAGPCWATGTALGIIAGNILPLRVVSALSVALYGMFLAIIIPPARQNKVIAFIVALSFACSFAADYFPLISQLSSGIKIIVLTVVLSTAAALLFPHKEVEQ